MQIVNVGTFKVASFDYESEIEIELHENDATDGSNDDAGGWDIHISQGAGDVLVLRLFAKHLASLKEAIDVPPYVP